MNTFTTAEYSKLSTLCDISADAVELMMNIAVLSKTDYLTVHDGHGELRHLEKELSNRNITSDMARPELAEYIGELYDSLTVVIRASDDDALFIKYMDKVDELTRIRVQSNGGKITMVDLARQGIYPVPAYCIQPRPPVDVLRLAV